MHRFLAAIPGIIAATAFFTSYLGNFYCNNIQFVPDVEFADLDLYSPRPQSFGLWTYRQQKVVDRRDGEAFYAESCAGYPSGTEFDSDWRLARAFSLLSVFSAGFLILWQLCAPFLLFDANYWRWAMVLFSFIGVCQGMTLKFLVSDGCWDNPLLPQLSSHPDIYEESCSWDWGTRASLASTILYFLTVLSLLFIPAPGLRPNERHFPMMVWDDEGMSDDEDEGSGKRDDESVTSFAFEEYDLDAEFAKTQKYYEDAPRDDTVSETEQSEYYDDVSHYGGSQYGGSQYDHSLSDISGLDDSTIGGQSDTDSFYNTNARNSRLV